MGAAHAAEEVGGDAVVGLGGAKFAGGAGDVAAQGMHFGEAGAVLRAGEAGLGFEQGGGAGGFVAGELGEDHLRLGGIGVGSEAGGEGEGAAGGARCAGVIAELEGGAGEAEAEADAAFGDGEGFGAAQGAFEGEHAGLQLAGFDLGGAELFEGVEGDVGPVVFFGEVEHGAGVEFGFGGGAGAAEEAGSVEQVERVAGVVVAAVGGL